MAHQAHNIPWSLLSSNLKLKLAYYSLCTNYSASDLHMRHKPTQGKELTYFIRVFARNIKSHADTQRKAFIFPDPTVPAPDDVVIDDEVARKITPTLRRWQRNKRYDKTYQDTTTPLASRELCEHRDSAEGCECVLPFRKRTMAGCFLPTHEYPNCYRWNLQQPVAVWNIEMYKALLLHGQMDTLFRIIAHPQVNFASWCHVIECMCNDGNLGWSQLIEPALDCYIMLNVISGFPDLHPSGEKEYRRLRCYQSLVYRCTRDHWETDIATYPHRQFFGIEDGQFWGRSAELRLGLLPYSEFLVCEKVVEQKLPPDEEHVSEARWLLCEKGLPVEIADLILDEASYRTHGWESNERDPMNADNRGELIRYLTYCWKQFVNTEMLAREVGLELDWESHLVRSIARCFSCESHPISRPCTDEDGVPWGDGWVFK